MGRGESGNERAMWTGEFPRRANFSAMKFAQMLKGSRWITVYVLSLLVAVEWISGLLYQVSPEVAWIDYGRWVFPIVFGYCTAVWLKAGERALRGRSVLGEGCFSVTKRDFLWAVLPYYALYFPLLMLLSTDPRRILLWGLICAVSMLVLPYVLLKQQSVSLALQSVRDGLQRKPQMIISGLVATGLLYTGSVRIVLAGYDYATEWMVAGYGQLGGGSGANLGWQVTSVVAYLFYLTLTALYWMLPGPAALWIYWKSTKQGAQ